MAHHASSFSTLPCHGLHAASQAHEERPISTYARSLARKGILHARGQARHPIQASKQSIAASGGTGPRLMQPSKHALSDCARQLGVPFQFRGIAAKREAVSPEDLDIDQAAEVVIVTSLCHFRLLADEIDISAAAVAAPGRPRPSARDQVLSNIRRMRPDVFIHGVVSGGYGTTYFPTRFREAMFYYSAQFDLLDATVPRDSPERLLLERDIFGCAAMNVVACEGTDRVECPETYRQWQARNQRAELRQLPLQADVVKVVMDKVKDNYHRDFVVDEDQGWLLHRWKGRVLYGLSTWVTDQ